MLIFELYMRINKELCCNLIIFITINGFGQQRVAANNVVINSDHILAIYYAQVLENTRTVDNLFKNIFIANINRDYVSHLNEIICLFLANK